MSRAEQRAAQNGPGGPGRGEAGRRKERVAGLGLVPARDGRCTQQLQRASCCCPPGGAQHADHRRHRTVRTRSSAPLARPPSPRLPVLPTRLALPAQAGCRKPRTRARSASAKQLIRAACRLLLGSMKPRAKEPALALLLTNPPCRLPIRLASRRWGGRTKKKRKKKRASCHPGLKPTQGTTGSRRLNWAHSTWVSTYRVPPTTRHGCFTAQSGNPDDDDDDDDDTTRTWVVPASDVTR